MPMSLQAEQPQLSQRFLTGEVLQSLSHLCGTLSAMSMFSLLLGSQDLESVLWVGPYQCHAQAVSGNYFSYYS